MHAFPPRFSFFRCACSFLLGLLALTAGACSRSSSAPSGDQASATTPTVQIVKPEKQTVEQRVEQPGFNIEAFQETPIYPRISGYIRKWNVDIGDKVQKNAVLAELDVPEMVVDLRQKEASLHQAEAQVAQAKANLLTAQAHADRAKSQYERLERVGKNGVLDRESIDEARLGFEAAKATLEKARADILAAEAHVGVARASRDYARTMLQFATLTAPYDGVVTQRNVNTGDFVQPLGTAGKGRPLYVVQQLDPVRVFVNVPGSDAYWIHDGDAVRLLLQGAGGETIAGKVTRTAHALDPRARTLRTEIDLPNPSGKLMPGMYVQATIVVKHEGVWALPARAITTEGDQAYCYRVVDGKAVRTPVQLGLRGENHVEIRKMQIRAAGASMGDWLDVSGKEEVVADAAGTRDGQPVR